MAEPAAPPAPPPANTPPPTGAPSPRRPRLVLRSVATALFSLLAVAATIGATVAWLIGTTSGMNAIVALANRFAPIKIETRGSFGALNREFGFAEIRVTVANTVVIGRAFRARLLHWQRQPLRLDFDHLQAGDLRFEVTTDPHPSPTPVQDIGVPGIELTAQRLAVGELTVAVDGGDFRLQGIEGRARAGPAGYRLDEGRVAYASRAAAVSFELAARRPFALHGQAQLTADVQDRPVAAAVRASGSLVELTIDGELSGAASGTFSAAIGSFDTPPLKSLALDLSGVDPHTWHAAAPSADLLLKATLAPNAAMDRVTGSVSAVNRAPGLLDAGHIPARSASAQIELDGRQLKLDRLAAQLLQGTAGGEFALQFADRAWQARARLTDVDPAQVHGALQSLRIDGQAQARQAGDRISVTAELAHRGSPAATLALDAEFTPQRATIRNARLALGDGFATAAGTVELSGSRRTELHGELQRFEPGRLVKGIEARLSGTVAVDGVLQPQPAGQARFELTDSVAWRRPLAGRGRVEIDSAQQVDVDVDLAVRSARLSAKGGLGAPERSLVLSLDAPALAELLPQSGTRLAGALKFNATARGAWSAPQVQAEITARGLRYGDHSVEELQGSASYGGGADGALTIAAGLGRYAYAPQPAAALRTLSLAVDGTLSRHGIRVQASSDKSQRAQLVADGGWSATSWRGRLNEATIGAPIGLQLLAPAALSFGTAGVAFGPAQLAVQHIRLDEVRFAADAAATTTSGRFSGLQPLLLAPPVEGAMAPVLAPVGERAPLEFRGQWDLRLAGDVADGRAIVERSGGDLYAGRGAESALRLVDARIEASLTANHLEAIARVESAHSGGLGAHLDARVENSPAAGWRLAQAQPWLISGAFDLPTMDWINALLSDHLRANVRLGGKLAGTMRIEGTPASPTASGRLSGSELRVAWVEQGVRLENGRLLAHLQDDLIVLDELHFAGPPRVRPDDRRAAAAVKADHEGSVSANGRLQLRDFSGVIQVAASDLPLLQRPDRWVIASGGANIETSARHVQLNGAAVAQAGFVDFSRSELPSLSSDVLVVRAEDAVETRARRVTLGFDLGIDLGRAFYLRGNGVDTRVEGALRLRSAGRGAVSAVGTIEAVDGIYEGFGQKLKIARGRLNFQGAPENPGLDILALRTGLPVEVGVTISRTAVNPLVRLHSDPPMADVEALSWLVLGRPADQSRGENIALVQAAASLLGGGGEGYPTRVVRALGFDEITVRSGQLGAASLLPARSVAGALRSDEASTATVAGEIVTLGKRFGEALSASYEQSISGTSRIVQLNYQLSRRLSLVARAGTSNALDLVYTIAFD